MDNQPTTAPDSEIRSFLILAVVLSVFLVLSVVLGLKIERKDVSSPKDTDTKPFPTVTLEAKATYVYDVRAQTILFAKNEHVRLPLASLTKMMSALVAEEASPLYGVVTISGEALRAEGDSGLYKGEKWRLKDLLDFSLITSSNDGMRAVALTLGALSKANATTEEILNDFVGAMNRKAGELGLKNTYFGNETGLDLSIASTSVGQVGGSEVKGGAYGTAKDMGTLLAYALGHHPELFQATRETHATLKSLDNRPHMATNTNSIAAEIPGLLASKTGFTNTAGGNLVFIFDPELGRPIVVSILGSTENGRFADARILIKAVMEYIINN